MCKLVDLTKSYARKQKAVFFLNTVYYQYRLGSPVDRSGRWRSEVYVQYLNILSADHDHITLSHYYLPIRQYTHKYMWITGTGGSKCTAKLNK